MVGGREGKAVARCGAKTCVDGSFPTSPLRLDTKRRCIYERARQVGSGTGSGFFQASIRRHPHGTRHNTKFRAGHQSKRRLALHQHRNGVRPVVPASKSLVGFAAVPPRASVSPAARLWPVRRAADWHAFSHAGSPRGRRGRGRCCPALSSASSRPSRGE